MREPAFWWRDTGLATGLLAPFAALYGAVASRRLTRDGHRAGVPVICIGNLTVGGAGKTPTAMAVARMLAGAGETPVLLSRGYGGALAGPLRVDPVRHRAGDVGDEPLLLARTAPTIVARDRVAGAAAAVVVVAGASVISSWTTGTRIRRCKKTARFSSSTRVAASATDELFRPAHCARPLRSSLPVPPR